MAESRDLGVLLGEPRRAIRSMMVPFLVSLLVIQVNIFADTFWVSGLGVDAVSGMTSAVPLYSIFTSIGIGMSVGVTATIAFRLGRRDKDMADRIAGAAVFHSLSFAVIGSVAMFLLMDLLVDLMGAQDVRQEVFDYVYPFLLMSPAIVTASLFGGLLRAEGSAKRSTAVQISAAVFNMILDPVFIYGLGLGITGAAFATTISALLAVFIALGWYLRGKTVVSLKLANIRPASDPSRDLLTVAGPRTVEGLVSNVVILIQRVFIIIAGGTVGVALFNVPFRYVTLCQCPSEATGMAMVPVAAAAYGRRDMSDMRSSMRYALGLALMFSFIMAVVLFILSGPFITFFTMEDSMAEWYDEFLWNMRAYCLILPLFTVQVVCSSMLQAVKRSRKPMEVTIILGMVRIFMFWLASYYDYRAITVALILSYVFSALFMGVLAKREIGRILRADDPRERAS